MHMLRFLVLGYSSVGIITAVADEFLSCNAIAGWYGPGFGRLNEDRRRAIPLWGRIVTVILFSPLVTMAWIMTVRQASKLPGPCKTGLRQ